MPFPTEGSVGISEDWMEKKKLEDLWVDSSLLMKYPSLERQERRDQHHEKEVTFVFLSHRYVFLLKGKVSLKIVVTL